MPDPRLDPGPDPKPDLVALLEELEQEREAEGMPVGARNRLQLAIRGLESRRHARWRRWVPAASFVAGAALVLTVVGNRWVSSSDAPVVSAPIASVAAPQPAVGAFHVEGPSEHCLVRTADDAAELAAHCSLVASHMTVQAWEATTVRAEGRNVHVRSGKVFFDVETVPRGEASVEVGVSHGTIEVIGTRFAVEQQDAGGHVDLLEGKIRFHHRDGRVEDVLPGQRLSWGDPVLELARADSEFKLVEPPVVEAGVEAGAEPQVEPSRRRGRGRGTDAQAAAIIERVTELRANKRFGAAITELRRALRRSWDGRTAQVLSYELGELLRAAEDPIGACEHFVAHQRRYPQGRYASAVDRVLERLDCE